MLAIIIITLPVASSVTGQQHDWLVHPKPYGPTTFSKWEDGYTLGNGLIERSFFAKGGA